MPGKAGRPNTANIIQSVGASFGAGRGSPSIFAAPLNTSAQEIASTKMI